MRETREARRTGLNRTRRDISTRPATSTMRSCGDCPGVSGRRWRMTSAYCGRTLSRLQQMGISMSQQTSYTAKLATTKDGTCAASLTYSSVSASKPNLSCCSNPTLGGTNWKWRIIYSICLRYN
jgi:hypothetical protein